MAQILVIYHTRLELVILIVRDVSTTVSSRSVSLEYELIGSVHVQLSI